MKKKIFTGIPEELDTFQEVVKETQPIRIRTEKRTYGKIVTIIEGIDPNLINVKDLLKKLKRTLGCGGSFDQENRVIELQGNHKHKLKKLLAEYGFSEDAIEIE